MKKTIAGALLLASTLLAPQLSSAEVFMCVDPDSGKKTFTDKACPNAGERTKVKVDPSNFGAGSKSAKNGGAWSSDKDTGVSGQDNLKGYNSHIDSARKAGTTD
ncbi:MAG: DUF4124 domain-containing protein [Halioglobus sp.]